MTAKWAEEKAREITAECKGLKCDCDEEIAAALKEAEARGRETGLEEAAVLVQRRPNLLLRMSRTESQRRACGVMYEVAEEIRALKSDAAKEGE